MTETELRNEIARRAPHLKVTSIGILFGEKEMDAVVQDKRGQYLWSVYARELNPQPLDGAPAPLAGQLNLF